jgi:DNA-binding transcriptional MocR family regulator
MNSSSIEKSSAKNLYERVADRFDRLINEGTLQPGDRLPSIRKLSQQLSVSKSTVLAAYNLLEDRGLIAARPQSGYFVKQISRGEPDRYILPKHNYPVDISLAFRVSETMRDPNKIKLGAAIPGTELLPIAALNRLMGKIMRAYPELSHSYHFPKGCEQLRQEIAKRLLEAGCSLTSDRIVITNGTAEAMYLSLKAVTKPGDTVALESPTYYGLLEILQSLHLKALELPTHPKEGISLEHLEAALKDRTIAACALVSNFSNPLSSCMSDLKKTS